MYIIMIEYMYNNVVKKTHIIKEILKKAIVYSSSDFFPFAIIQRHFIAIWLEIYLQM